MRSRMPLGDFLVAYLRAAHHVKDLVIVECRVPPDDISPVSRRYLRASAKK